MTQPTLDITYRHKDVRLETLRHTLRPGWTINQFLDAINASRRNGQLASFFDPDDRNTLLLSIPARDIVLIAPVQDAGEPRP